MLGPQRSGWCLAAINLPAAENLPPRLHQGLMQEKSFARQGKTTAWNL